MQLPFSTHQFFEVFARYNEAVWPAQAALLLLALVAIGAAVRRSGSAGSSRLVAAILAVLWAWMGVVYHIGFFRPINAAATLFGGLFVAQAGLLLWYAMRRDTLRFSPPVGARGAAGAALIAYALVIYPVLGVALGHGYPEAPTFGLPCPTTIFTLGLLLWTIRSAPWPVLVVPIGWAVVGTSAALQLGMVEDLGLPVAAAVVLIAGVHDRLSTRSRRHAYR
ncbi:MAG TPA: DUF6064 family protein [Gemmatimonadaceae bacterium]|nr:DUF6064 family protein [Gemmatimonadaceae bacterium]